MNAERAAQIEQALVAAQTQAAQQAAQIADLNNRAAAAEQRAQAAVAAAQAANGPRAQQPAPRDGGRLIDTRVLGKPSDFTGEPGTWRDWSTIFRAYSAACEPALMGLMEHAERA